MLLRNFGRFDEKLKEKNISGLSNGSKLDEEIWNEFNNKWDELAYESETILQHLQESKEIRCEGVRREGKEVERLVKTRVNQNFFRATILASYEGKCCITGLTTEKLLIASHIKPWRDCDADEKTNPRNGLCLNSLHDAAYDKGFMTVGTDFKIHISDEIADAFHGETVYKFFKAYEGTKIMLPEKFMPCREFLEYHGDIIFENWKR